MKIDPVMAVLGLAEGEETDALEDLIREEAGRFARGGAGFTWTEWQQLEALTQDAFCDAHDDLRIEGATAIGQASQGMLEAARLYSAVDGGDQMIEVAVQSQAEKMVKDLVKGPVSP